MKNLQNVYVLRNVIDGMRKQFNILSDTYFVQTSNTNV